MIKYIHKILNSNQNNKAIIYNTLGAFIVKGGALFISLLAMPAYINYFDNQLILGLWFTILSILSWILTFDLGIGNGLRNHLVLAIVNQDQLKIKKYISSAYVVIGSIVFFVISLSFVFFRYINWNIVFNISSDIVSKSTLNLVIGIIFSGIMLQFLLKLITSILYALQKSAINNFLSLLTSILTLVYVLIVSPSDITTNLIGLAIINVLAVNIPLLIATLIVFKKYLTGCSPSLKYFKIKYAQEVMSLGSIFFWVQIMYMIITATNEFLITWFSSPTNVVEYQIYNKLFTLVGVVFTLALTPIWSAVTKAFTELNFVWIKKLYNTLKIMAIIALFFEFVMILFLQLGVDLWLGKGVIKVNYFYAIIFAIFGGLIIWNGVISSIANGCGELRTQSIYFSVGAIIKIPLAFIFVRIFDSWIGVILANIMSMSIYCIIQPFVIDKFLNNDIK